MKENEKSRKSLDERESERERVSFSLRWSLRDTLSQQALSVLSKGFNREAPIDYLGKGRLKKERAH